MVYYQKYRPQSLSEIIGQEPVVQALQSAYLSGRLSHAYLFCGPRGTGKTSTARILAKMVNCTGGGAEEGEGSPDLLDATAAKSTTRHPDDGKTIPCNKCSSCLSITDGSALDLIEIDAASNRGVDDIRELRDKIKLSPSSLKKKVYVIDECFRYEDLISLADGSKLPIGKIVENGLPVEVLSYNEQTYSIEPKPIVGYMRKQPELPSVEITFNNNRVVVCTVNHRFYTPKGLIPAEQLKVGQFVYAKSLIPQQLNVITGVALGDGYIGLSSSEMGGQLSMNHGVMRQEYLDYKLLPKYRNKFVSLKDDKKLSDLSVSRVKDIKLVSSPEYVYNIEVADNHNYFVRDILVANCHMLTNEAFNALLKTLEEPPSHCLFILATTEMNKIPATIISRVQRLDFKPASSQDLIKALRRVCKGEQLEIEEAALQLIAQKSEGAFRDGVKLLDQLASRNQTISLSMVEEGLKTTKLETVSKLLSQLARQDSTSALKLLLREIGQGVNIRDLTLSILEVLRSMLLIKHQSDELLREELLPQQYEALKKLSDEFQIQKLIHLIQVFQQAAEKLKFSMLASLPIEVAIVESCWEENQQAGVGSVDSVPVDATKGSKNAKTLSQPEPDQEAGSFQSLPGGIPAAVSGRGQGSMNNAAAGTTDPQDGADNEKGDGGETIRSEAGTIPGADLAILLDKWSYLLEVVKPYNFSLEAMLRQVKIGSCENRRVILKVPYTFHQRILESPRNRDFLESVLTDILGKPFKVGCELDIGLVKVEDISNIERVAADDEVIRLAAEIFNS